MSTRDRAADDLGELPRVGERVPALDRDEHMHAVGAARLRERDEAERVERRLHDQRRLHRLREADVVRRIEVEEHEVGPVRPVDARVPRVHVDAAHVHHPEERRLVVHERRLDPLRFRGDSRVETSARNVEIHSGMCDGTSFWKNALPYAPSG